MNITDLVQRSVPRPWEEGYTIPWNEPGFSQRMLHEHLSQQHDAASRRFEIIDQHVRFLHEQILGGKPGRVLDLACGPGLYALRLARLGHTVRGVDFSPASVAYAREAAWAEGQACIFDEEDIRIARFREPGDPGYDLVMLIYGEFNVFNPADARAILARACDALKPGGTLLLEPSSEEATRRIGADTPGWKCQEHGLFADYPHLLLSESFWDEAARVVTRRYYVIDLRDGQAGNMARFAGSYQVYRDEELCALLAATGFTGICFYPNLTGAGERQDFPVITARRPAA